MGVWGSEPFDSDTALDYLSRTVGALKQQIEQDLELAEGDGQLERLTLAAVACLRAIVSQIEAARHRVNRMEVESWRKKYLNWLERSISEMGAQDATWAVAVRRSAESEFDLLLSHLAKGEKKSRVTGEH